MSDTFPIQSGLKEGASLLPLFLIFPLQQANCKVQENQDRLKLYGTRQCLVYANVNLMGKNINTDVDVLEVFMV